MTYRYLVEGTAAGGQTWATEGRITVAQAGDFPRVTQDALRDSFMQLTSGKAVYGQPGVGCTGPYTITKLTVEREAL